MRLIPAALVLAFTIYCVVDVVRSGTSDVRGLPKPFWVVVVLLAPPVGGIAWLVAGRPRTARLPGTARRGTPRPPAVGPDDDPDFLRSIDRPRPVGPAGPLGPGTPGPAGSDDPAGGTGRDPGSDPDDDPGDAGSGTSGGTGDSGRDPDGPTGRTGDDTGPGTTAGQDDRRS